MRISDKKINRITKNILAFLENDKETRILGDMATIEAEIKSIIITDLKEEDIIEEEAKKILEEHSNVIAGENIDYMALLNRTKRQIARQRGFVL